MADAVMSSFPARTASIVLAAAIALSAAPGWSATPARSGPVTPELSGPATFSDHETERCLRCHGMPNFAVRDSATGLVRDLTVSARVHRASVHGRLSCRQCHVEIESYPHRLPRTRVGCGNDCHTTDSKGRAYRHTEELDAFARSVHAGGLAERDPDLPTCVTCHGAGSPHAVPSARRAMNVSQKMALCADCHENRVAMARHKVDPDAVPAYRRSFHFKAIRFGARGTAVCQDCHSVHHVLSPRAAGSTVSPARLPETCGQKACHPGARMNFAMSGANHLTLRIHRTPVLELEERFFAGLTWGTMLALLAGIVLDVQRRLGWRAALTPAATAFQSMASAAGRGSRALLRLARRLFID